jgi:hypothetical protein
MASSENEGAANSRCHDAVGSSLRGLERNLTGPKENASQTNGLVCRINKENLERSDDYLEENRL